MTTKNNIDLLHPPALGGSVTLGQPFNLPPLSPCSAHAVYDPFAMVEISNKYRRRIK